MTDKRVTGNQPVLVTGGTGTLGRHVVPLLTAAGAEVRVLSRRPPGPASAVPHLLGDLDGGDGVDAALEGVGTVVHCAGSNQGDDRKAALLAAAAEAAGVTHIVHISVVGADRMPVTSRTDRMMFGYFAAKRGAEEALTAGAVPVSILRATQFHDLVLTVVRALVRLPVVPVPRDVRLQPVQVEVVAERLVALALAGPEAGGVREVGGPAVHPLGELVRSYLRATEKHRALVPVPLPGRAARVFADGANLLGEAGEPVGGGWEAFLTTRLDAVRKAPTP